MTKCVKCSTMLHVSDSSCVTICCDVAPDNTDVLGQFRPLMPRNVKRCIGCEKRYDNDKGHKYTVSDTEYLCQECYNKDRYADDVCPLCFCACSLLHC
jgi:hypothetical protein